MSENTQNNNNDGVTISDEDVYNVPVYTPEPTVTRVQDLIEDQRETSIRDEDRSQLEAVMPEIEPAESDKVVESQTSRLSNREKQARRNRKLVLGLLLLLAMGVIGVGLSLNVLGF